MNPNLNLNKILEQFNSLSDQIRYAILGGVVVVIILLDVFLLVLPQMNAINSIYGQVQKMSDDTQEVLTDRQRIVLLRKNLREARLRSEALTVKVRSMQEVPAILSTISSIANEYGVKIDEMVPEKNLQETLTADADGKYYALPIEIKARCGYHMFGRFLNKLENGNLFFLLKDFIIQNDEKDPNTHLFSLTINIILVDRSLATAKSL